MWILVKVQLPNEERTPGRSCLEGSDQHRGWFQSSLISSIAMKDEAHTSKVLTHGFVVDGNAAVRCLNLSVTLLLLQRCNEQARRRYSTSMGCFYGLH
ncbi:class I tRNA ligase family protein [Vibrio lentus]|nr:class I tRNA ligase family protein [Vibrio lentus]